MTAPAPLTRITQLGSNTPLRISDLIDLLAEIKRGHDDFYCYIYSADRRASVPMLALCLDIRHTQLVISAQTGSVVDEQLHDLIEEIERLRNQLEATPCFNPRPHAGGDQTSAQDRRANP